MSSEQRLSPVVPGGYYSQEQYFALWDKYLATKQSAEQAEQRAREWEIVAGHLEAKLIDVQERGRALEGALRKVLGWCDLWKGYEDSRREIARALAPPPAEEGAGNG